MRPWRIRKFKRGSQRLEVTSTLQAVVKTYISERCCVFLMLVYGVAPYFCNFCGMIGGGLSVGFFFWLRRLYDFKFLLNGELVQ
jgi:hypothetical protein